LLQRRGNAEREIVEKKVIYLATALLSIKASTLTRNGDYSFWRGMSFAI